MNTAKPERIALFCLTPGGVALARRLHSALPMTCFTREGLVVEGFLPFDGSFSRTVQRAFTHYSALVFIGATGIAVRVLAPLLVDKLRDPAVVVIDERGQHVISLLSGHVGGANDLARRLAGILDVEPVITTATDVNEVAALDTLACQLNARMHDFRAAVKAVNQMLVSQQRVGLWWDDHLALIFAAATYAVLFRLPIFIRCPTSMGWCVSPCVKRYPICRCPIGSWSRGASLRALAAVAAPRAS